jgi:3-hydroxyacyl-[acyl-carrier-protein] dehydratase
VRFHLIDRIHSLEPSRSVHAQKLTSLHEEFWDDTDGEPVMPPPLVLEALCQAGSWLLIISTELRQRAALLSIGSVTFGDAVHAGDVLDIEGTIDSMGDEVAVLSGTVKVDGNAVLEAHDIMCVLIDAADLEDLEDTGRMARLLTRSGGSS